MSLPLAREGTKQDLLAGQSGILKCKMIVYHRYSMWE